MIALGPRARGSRARGHAADLERAGRSTSRPRALRFAPAPEYQVFPSGPGAAGLLRGGRPRHRGHPPARAGAAAGRRRGGHPHARARAGRRARRTSRWATLIPHVYPHGEPHFPIYSLGARLPRTAVGRALWRRPRGRSPGASSWAGRAQPHARQTGPAARSSTSTAGISRELAIVGTFPQLEYPRAWPPNVHVVGPLMWEPPAQEVELPPGDAPLVLVAPSTAQDPEHRLLRAALRGLADARCACSRPGTGACHPVRCRCPRTRGSSTGSPTRAPCPTATSSSATPATARSRGRSHRGCAVVACPRGGRHERERRPPRLGRRGRAGPPPLRLAPPASPGCGASARGPARSERGRASWPRGPRRMTRASTRRGSSRGSLGEPTRAPELLTQVTEQLSG